MAKSQNTEDFLGRNEIKFYWEDLDPNKTSKKKELFTNKQQNKFRCRLHYYLRVFSFSYLSLSVNVLGEFHGAMKHSTKVWRTLKI